MNVWRVTTVATACVAASVVVSGCVRSSDGVPIAESQAESQSESPSETTWTNSPSTSSAPTPAPSTTGSPSTEYGVLPTLQVPVPAGTVTCAPPLEPGKATDLMVSDPQAPQITVSLPDGWSSIAGSGDVAAELTGPAGVSATVTIAQTDLDPGEAFRDYTDRIMDQAAISSVSILPGELCEYSGQELMGAWSDTPQNSVEFRDRIVHIWTNTANYLVSIHVEAPTGVDELDDAGRQLTADFPVRIP